MHYYQFNIADYRKDTGHLSPMEHFIYRQLIDWYYLDEEPIPAETQLVMRRLGLVTDSDKSNLQNVLSDFFERTEQGYMHSRIEEELEKYRAKADTARENGKKGGRPRKQALSSGRGTKKKPKKTQPVISGNPEETGSKANQEPITNNQEPRTNALPPLPPKGAWAPPQGIDAKAWGEFEQHRKEMRQPLSDLARTKAAAQLLELTPAQQQVCVNMTIQNRWRGLFPEKARGQVVRNRQTDLEASNQQAADTFVARMAARSKHEG